MSYRQPIATGKRQAGKGPRTAKQRRQLRARIAAEARRAKRRKQ
ncbi:MAG TPA: hypothetical protein VM345_17890 [Acidimicrobiales bacterium]|nr:hypothetical protein [Acidimicrobiales bacterium]